MHTQRGFTFIELLFSLGLFMIGLYGVVGLQMAVFYGNQRSSDITLASNLCSSVLEDLHIRDLTGLTGGETFYFDAYGAEQSDPSYFTVIWVDNSAAPDLAYSDLQVTASWLRPGEQATADWNGHRVSFNTRIIKKVTP